MKDQLEIIELKVRKNPFYLTFLLFFQPIRSRIFSATSDFIQF